MEGQGAVDTDAEWLTLLNAAYLELWDLVATTYGDHFVAGPTEFTLAGATDAGASYTLPADFYRLRGLDYLRGSRPDGWEEVTPFAFAERNHPQDRRNYALQGAALIIRPVDWAQGTYRIWYTPAPTLLSSDGDTVDARVAQWEDYIVVRAAIKAKDKEESDVSVLMAELEMFKQRIRAVAPRDAGHPPRVVDTRIGRWRRGRHNEAL